MKAIWAVCKREFVSYFVTPVGYVVVGTYATIAGLGFSASFLFYARISENPQAFAYSAVPDFEETLLSPLMVFCGMLVMFIGPLVTMRLLAGERSRGTMELLLTHPLRDRDIVFGKYLAGLGMLAVMISALLVQLAILAHYVTVEPAVLGLGLLAVALMGAAFISLGLFVSAMTNNPITAGSATFGLVLVLYTLDSLAESLPKKNPAPDAWPEVLRNAAGSAYELFRGFTQALSLDGHAKDMAQGIFQPEDIAYYILFTALFLFLTFRALESRKWRA